MSDRGFTYKSCGINNEGNHYCARDYGNGSNAYHYSNRDGSYYYSNPNGSTYYNNGNGGSTYTSPSGYRVSSGYGNSGSSGGSSSDSSSDSQKRQREVIRLKCVWKLLRLIQYHFTGYCVTARITDSWLSKDKNQDLFSI